jgi:hypothetical protein
MYLSCAALPSLRAANIDSNNLEVPPIETDSFGGDGSEGDGGDGGDAGGLPDIGNPSALEVYLNPPFNVLKRDSSNAFSVSVVAKYGSSTGNVYSQEITNALPTTAYSWSLSGMEEWTVEPSGSQAFVLCSAPGRGILTCQVTYAGKTGSASVPVGVPMLWMDLCPEAQRDEATAKAGYETLKSIAGGAIVSPAKAYPIHYDLGITLDELEAEPGQSVSMTFTLQSGDQLFYDAAQLQPIASTGTDKYTIPLTGLTEMPEVYYVGSTNLGEISARFHVDAFEVGNEVDVFAATMAIPVPWDSGTQVFTEEGPFEFWVNDDYDDLVNHPLLQETEEDDKASGTKNCDDDIINGKRDLEDFSRLSVRFGGMYSAILDGRVRVGMKWVNQVTPSIKLWRNYSDDGSVGYLFDASVAQSHTLLRNPGLVEGNQVYSIPVQFWSDVGLSSAHKDIGMLFEGCKTGKGELQLVMMDAQNRILAEGPSIWINLVEPSMLVERYSCGEGSNGAVGALTHVSGTAGFGLPMNDDERDFVLYVHGYNMESWEKQRWIETTYKRLYWLGYKGRVGGFSWPCANGAVDQVFFDTSENRAWQSGAPLMQYLAWLKARGYRVHVLAHSQGNIAMGEALRLWRGDGNSSPLVSTYIASQAAIPSACYNSNAPWMPNWDMEDELIPRYPLSPDIYARYWRSGDDEYVPVQWPDTNVSYLSSTFMSSAASRWVNVYNRSDYALTGNSFSHLGWEICQRQKPNDFLTDSVWTYSYTESEGFGEGFFTRLKFPDDRYKIFSFAAGTWSLALGTIPTGGVFSNFTNLQSMGYGDEHIWHSAQFRSYNAARYQYWNEVMIKAQIKKVQ